MAGRVGRHLYDQARGVASDRVGVQAGRQSISKETTFNEDETDQQRLRKRLRSLASEVGRIARRKGLKGRVVTLKIRLNGFETHTRQRKISVGLNADGETQESVTSATALADAMFEVMDQLWEV